MAEMKDVVTSLLGRWAVPALKLIQIVSNLLICINRQPIDWRFLKKSARSKRQTSYAIQVKVTAL